MRNFYHAKAVSLLTQHGKEKIIAPLLQPFLGCQISHTTAYDTDLLGTFSGETLRIENQIETARKKARIGMDLTGLQVGLASEGAFVADPFGGLLPWNVEIVVWLDDERHFEVIGIAQGPARSVHRTIRKMAELENFTQEAGFPEHHVVLRPEDERDARIHKGIADWDNLRKIFLNCLVTSANGLVFAENDHRAFCSPTRQAMIVRATQDLMKKFESLCPACGLPGFSITGHKAGLHCNTCGSTTRLPKSFIWQCQACQHLQEKASDKLWAQPSECDVCNP